VKELVLFFSKVSFTSRTCAIRGDSEIQGIKLPGGKDGEYIETKLCMFADDTQLFNKNEESVKKSFEKNQKS
jgi:hypothetical protein